MGILNIGSSIKKKLSDFITKMIKEEVRLLISEEFIPMFVEKAKEVYNREFVSIEGSWGKKDPTSPSALQSEFNSYITNNARNLIEVGEKGVYLNNRYLADFGAGAGVSKSETNKQKLLYFYFAGIIGSYGFIDQKVYEEMTGKEGARLGRFGKGYFISSGAYEKIKSRKSELPPFSEIESPLSGRAGRDVIKIAYLETLPVLQNKIIKKGIDIAIKKFNRK